MSRAAQLAKLAPASSAASELIPELAGVQTPATISAAGTTTITVNPQRMVTVATLTVEAGAGVYTCTIDLSHAGPPASGALLELAIGLPASTNPTLAWTSNGVVISGVSNYTNDGVAKTLVLRFRYDSGWKPLQNTLDVSTEGMRRLQSESGVLLDADADMVASFARYNLATVLTARRTYRLPAANTLPFGGAIEINLFPGTVGGLTVFATIARATGSSDVIGAYELQEIDLVTPGIYTFYSDGASKWTHSPLPRARFVFTASNSNWRAPVGYMFYQFACLSGGGGGGAGCVGDAGVTRFGGAPGGAGGWIVRQWTFDAIWPMRTAGKAAFSLNVVVGAGGVGGAATTSAGTGNNGTDGGDSSVTLLSVFHNNTKLAAGNRGTLGTGGSQAGGGTSGAHLGNPTTLRPSSTSGGNVGTATTTTTGAVGQDWTFGHDFVNPTVGQGGGGLDAANTSHNGRGNQRTFMWGGNDLLGGTAPGGNGADASTMHASLNNPMICQVGGTGGAAGNDSVAGGRGGDGRYGSGGGGGGAGVTGIGNGRGGNGGSGVVCIDVW